MKNILLMPLVSILSIPFVLFSCSVDADVLIGNSRVGDYFVGQAKDELKLSSKASLSISSRIIDGEIVPVTTLIFPGDHYVIVVFSDDERILRFSVAEKIFVTEGNIRVGSSFKEVIDAYPDYDLYYGQEDGGYLSVSVKSQKILFGFDPSILTDEPIESYEKLYDLKVRSISIR